MFTTLLSAHKQLEQPRYISKFSLFYNIVPKINFTLIKLQKGDRPTLNNLEKTLLEEILLHIETMPIAGSTLDTLEEMEPYIALEKVYPTTLIDNTPVLTEPFDEKLDDISNAYIYPVGILDMNSRGDSLASNSCTPQKHLDYRKLFVLTGTGFLATSFFNVASTYFSISITEFLMIASSVVLATLYFHNRGIKSGKNIAAYKVIPLQSGLLKLVDVIKRILR